MLIGTGDAIIQTFKEGKISVIQFLKNVGEARIGQVTSVLRRFASNGIPKMFS